MDKRVKDKNIDKSSMKKSQKKNMKDEKQQIFEDVAVNLNSSSNGKKGNNMKKKGKKKNNVVLKSFLVIILICVVTLAGLFVKRMNENGWTLGGFVATILGHDSSTLANLSRINVLVIGRSQNLTDTLLVCSYDPKIQEVSILSIPRDTFVGKNKNSATASDKINSIYQYGPDKLLKKVNEITNLDIKYYVKVDTDGLRELVDSIGGVYFDVPIDMDYDDPSQDLYIHLKAGYQLLDGDKAEQAVRFRHNNNGTTYPIEYGQEDIGRMKTQRAFITEVIKQMAKPENITKVDDYIKIANSYLETNFNLWNLKDYAPYALDYKTENMKTATLPGVPEKCNDVWVYIYNKKETNKIVNELFKNKLTVEQTKNAEIKINILNGTNDNMRLNNMKNILEENGYTVVSTANTSATEKTTIINRTGQAEEIANEIKETIGVGLMSNSVSEKKNIDFTIIIGADY